MPENINIKSDEILCVARGQAVVEARQNVDGNCRVLSASASAVTNPSEVFAGEARYVGKVAFDCLIAVEDGVQCISAVAEFSDKITSPDFTSNSHVTLIPDVINVEAHVEGGTLKMIAVVDVSAVSTVGEECPCMAATDDGVYAEKRTVEYSTVSGTQTETVYVVDSITESKIAEVLFTTSRAVITSAEAADGEVKVAGAVYSVGIIKQEDGMIATTRVITPFVKSMAVMGVNASDNVYATAAVTESAATAVEGESRLDIASTVVIDVIATSTATADIVTDVFCADCEIEKKTAKMKCQTAESLALVIDTVDGQIPIPADKNAADAVLCITGTYCTLSDVKVEDERVTVEGLVGGDIVYYNAEKNAVDVLSFRLPFAMPLSTHTDADAVFATCEVTDVNVRIRRESVFDIKAELAFALKLSSEKEYEYVAAVELGEPIPRPDAAVIIHIAKPGETLWQAAKALCCSPERVTEQNSAAAPYAGGERLINFCNK